jgi:uncharacterized protein
LIYTAGEKSSLSGSPIFVDTSFIVALINERDQYHIQASQLADQFDGQPLVVTDAVLLEIANSLARNYKAEAIQVIEELLCSDEVELVSLTPELFQQAFVLYKARQDKTWGLVDCISFTVMQMRGITITLTFDQHFAQAGFQALRLSS